MSASHHVDDVLADWQSARERGEFIDPEVLIVRHPDIADALRERFDAIRVLDQLLIADGVQSRVNPQRLGDYRIVRELGRGGMGVVYEAEQMSLRRPVALKVLFPAVTRSRNAVERFQREARIAARLHHTNIVQVHALGREDGNWFYAMDLVDGGALDVAIARSRDLLTESGTPESSDVFGTGTTGGPYFSHVADRFAGVAEALHAAHGGDVIHRDVKPSNLILGETGSLHLTDFGVARLTDGTRGLTATGDTVGTPNYMSPEQVRGTDAVDHRTDVYSLGATLYEVLTLAPPFDTNDVGRLYADILTKEPAAPARGNSSVPRDLETIVVKAMQKDPARRYVTAEAMARDLRSFSEGRGIEARRPPWPARAWRVIKRRRVPIATGSTILLLLLGTLWIGSRHASEQRRRVRMQYDQLLEEAHHAAESDAPRSEVAALLDRAVALDHERYEAYESRAGVGEGGQEVLADLAAARARGMPERRYHLKRGLYFEDVAQPQQAASSFERARALPRIGGDASLDVVLLMRDAAYAQAEVRATEAIAASPPGSWRARHLVHQRALARLGRGKWSAALDDFLSASAGRRARAGAAAGRLFALRKLGRTGEAKAYFEGLLAGLEDESPERWMGLAEALRGHLLFDLVDTVTERAVAVHEDHAGLWYARAWFLCTRNDAAALTAIDRALTLDRDVPHGTEIRALALAKNGRIEEAGQALDAAAEAGGNDPRHLVMRAHFASRHRQDHEGALALLQRALEEGHPDPAGIHLQRAEVLLSLRRRDEAALALDEVDRMRPGCTQGLRAAIAWLAGDYPRTVELADEALQVSPTYPFALQARGHAWIQQGGLEQGLDDLEHAASLDPTLHALLGDLASWQYTAGRHEKALATARQAIDLKSARPEVPVRIGLAVEYGVHAARAHGRDEDARRMATEAMERWPDVPRIWAALATAQRPPEGTKPRDEDIVRCRSVVERGLEQWPGHPVLSLWLAEAYNVMRRYDDTLRVVDAVRLDPGNADPFDDYVGTRVKLAREQVFALWESGRRKEAWDALKEAKALTEHPILTVKLRHQEAAMLLHAGDAKAANELLGDIDPVQTRYNEIVTDTKAGRFAEAREKAAAFTKAYPTRLPSWHIAGMTELFAGEPARAAELFAKGIEACDEDPRPLHSMRAVALISAGRLTEAEKVLTRVAVTTTTRAEDGFNWARLYVAQGRYDEAEAVLRPQWNQYAQGMLVGVLARLGKPGEAKKVLKRLLDTWPDHRRAALAFSMLEIGEIDGAVAMLEAMQTASRRGSTNGLVQAYRQAGRDKDARELAWKHAGQDHPSMNAVNYAYLAAVAGIPERAHDLLEAAKPSESGQVHLLRARVHAVLGEMDQARSWLRKAHAAGYRHPRTAAEDVDFRPLADDPAWTTLLE